MGIGTRVYADDARATYHTSLTNSVERYVKRFLPRCVAVTMTTTMVVAAEWCRQHLSQQSVVWFSAAAQVSMYHHRIALEQLNKAIFQRAVYYNGPKFVLYISCELPLPPIQRYRIHVHSSIGECAFEFKKYISLLAVWFFSSSLSSTRYVHAGNQRDKTLHKITISGRISLLSYLDACWLFQSYLNVTYYVRLCYWI